MVLNQDTHERLIHSLSSWHFEPHKLPEEEVIACSYILFEALYRIENMQETVSVSLGEYLLSLSVPSGSLPVYARANRGHCPVVRAFKHTVYLRSSDISL